MPRKISEDKENQTIVPADEDRKKIWKKITVFTTISDDRFVGSYTKQMKMEFNNIYNNFLRCVHRKWKNELQLLFLPPESWSAQIPKRLCDRFNWHIFLNTETSLAQDISCFAFCSCSWTQPNIRGRRIEIQGPYYSSRTKNGWLQKSSCINSNRRIREDRNF